MIKVLKVRRGHATNSSASHSIILAGSFPEGEPWESYQPEYDWDVYGEDWFLISEEQGKLRYFAVQLKTILSIQSWEDPERPRADAPGGSYTEWWSRKDFEYTQIVNSLFEGILEDPITEDTAVSGNAEWGTLCKDREGNNAYEFFREFAEACAKDSTLEIRGGNDEGGGPLNMNNNYGTPHPAFILNSIALSNLFIAVKDQGIWKLFNKRTGTKIHLDLRSTISNARQVPVDYRPSAPELVDLKITDQCTNNCPVPCYQDSGSGGSHARTRGLWAWMDSCKEAGIFELAIGGGEPTEHPDFASILEKASSCFDSVNFSTRSLKWVENREILEAVRSYVSSVGFSISTLSELKRAMGVFKDYSVRIPALRGKGAPVKPVTWHYIPELYSFSNFKSILKELTFTDTLLLLGYKDVGRAGPRRSRMGAKVIAHVASCLSQDESSSWKLPNIAVDTCFARKYGTELRDLLGVDDRFFYTQEGLFSMYYDAVANAYGPSSYEPHLLKPAGNRVLPDYPCPVQQMFCNIPVSV